MRYPSRSGLAIPIQELGYEVATPQRRQTSQHHLFFERGAYNLNPLHRVFRGLISNVYTMHVHEHADLHERYSAPIKPKDGIMLDVIDEYISLNGVIDVVREKRTHETYQITPDQWVVS